MKHGASIGKSAAAMVGLGLALAAPASAQAPAVSRPIRPLTGVRPPAPSPGDYAGIVKDSSVLVALGKALFWDTQVGGANGQACASCHFHAGADPRTVNQLSPGLNVQPDGDLTFGAAGKMGSGAAAGPNIALAPGDFPFHKLADAADRESAVLFDTNDVASSQGAFQGGPVTLNENNPVGQRTRCASIPGAPFAISAGGASLNTRKVEPRNTPTSVNTVFMVRNFWDGRANNVFNGVNPFGRRAIAADPAVRVFRTDGSTVSPQALTLENMSAASQAVGPVLSSFEMTCQGKAFPDVGRRLMQQRALGNQAVASDDSVFSSLSGIKVMPASSGGISANYRELVRAAFQPAYWQDNHYYTLDRATGQVSPGGGASNGYQIDELNFSMFFGLAIDAYERTLISDQSPFDAGTLSADAQAGKALFTGKASCASCHDGPLFSAATTFGGDSSFLPVERMAMADPAAALYDNGFYNIGVRPTFEDIGVGNTDPYGNPLSFTRQFVLRPGTSSIGVDQFSLDPCHLQIPFDSASCSSIPTAAQAQSQRVAVDGAFKVPSLRNVALTAPYFHNGGQKSLDEVVAFYNRGGDRRSVSGGDTSGTGPLGRPVVSSSNPVTPGMGGSNADADVKPLGLSAGQQGQIVAFLKELTDRRVACHQKPFDHPALPVANGHVAQDKDKDGNADDVPYALRAVGAGGYGKKCDDNFDALNSGNLFTSAPAFEAIK